MQHTPTLLSLRARAAHPPKKPPQPAQVMVAGYFYAVDLGSTSPPGGHSPPHRVGKDRRCSCPLGKHCPAVQAVADHLRAGGERAPDPPPGFFPVAPAECPVCGAETIFDNSLSSKRRGAGWRCTLGSSAHYWQAHVQILKQKFADNPWLFPPVVVRDGKQMAAYDGILPGDRVLSPGLLRADT
ncbi:MAG TPA: hypothetical protein PKH92_08340 [Anaerolineaceae bacterium]|nr:hypothetical protein [Anaerolineaceae bacterium]